MTPPNFTSLTQRLKPGQLLTSRIDLLTYEVDAALDRGKPDAVVFPETAEDVEYILQWAQEAGVPLVARGAGTGLSGGAVAEHGGLIVCFSRMNRLLAFDPVNRSACVEPGMVNLKLDEAVKKAGLYFPPDPASGRSATLGGNIAENAGGPHCFKYGVTTNYLTGLEVVLADGARLQLGGAALDYPEYDWMGVITGSEGTLALVTGAQVRLLRNPPAVQTLMAAFNTVEAAGQAVSALIACGLVPATMEMMDQKMMGIIEDYVHAGLPVRAGAALIIEVDSYPESLDAQMDEIVALLGQHQAWDVRLAQNAEERERIWYGRKSAAGAMARLSPAYYLLDGTVPRSKLAEALAATTRICDELELRVSYVFHAGDGNLHPFILIPNPQDPALMQRVHTAGQRIMQICVGLGGSLTGEHGVGIEKRKFMPLMYTPAELSAMQDIKQVFDPQGLLNPGKIFPTPAEIAVLGELARQDEKSAVESPPGVDEQIGRPATVQEAAGLVRAWRQLGESLRVRGAGTHSTGLPGTVHVLSTSLLRGVQQYARDDLYVVAGAGTKHSELQDELAHEQMWVPLLSLWDGATLGGMLSANLNAPLRMKYGGLRDLLLAAEVVLPDGRIIQAGRPVVKNVAGYDLAKLFAGSHGTLGLVTAAAFKLAPLPRRRCSLVAPILDLELALERGKELLPVCLNASALLVFGHASVPIPGGDNTAPYTLVYTVEGLPGDVDAELRDARRVLQAVAKGEILAVEDFSGSEHWAAWLQKTAAASAQPLLRLGTGPGALAGLTATYDTMFGSPFCADLANGQLWIPALPQGNAPTHLARDLAQLRSAAEKQGGYLVSQPTPYSDPHFPGAGFRPWGDAHPASYNLMWALKQAWDPQNLFNPGAFVV